MVNRLQITLGRLPPGGPLKHRVWRKLEEKFKNRVMQGKGGIGEQEAASEAYRVYLDLGDELKKHLRGTGKWGGLSEALDAYAFAHQNEHVMGRTGKRWFTPDEAHQVWVAQKAVLEHAIKRSLRNHRLTGKEEFARDAEKYGQKLIAHLTKAPLKQEDKKWHYFTADNFSSLRGSVQKELIETELSPQLVEVFKHVREQVKQEILSKREGSLRNALYWFRKHGKN